MSTTSNRKPSPMSTLMMGQELATDSLEQPALSDADAYRRATAAPVATPLVKRTAAHHGIDLAGVTGTGTDGSITLNDVLDATRANKATASSTDDAYPAHWKR